MKTKQLFGFIFSFGLQLQLFKFSLQLQKHFIFKNIYVIRNYNLKNFKSRLNVDVATDSNYNYNFCRRLSS